MPLNTNFEANMHLILENLGGSPPKAQTFLGCTSNFTGTLVLQFLGTFGVKHKTRWYIPDDTKIFWTKSWPLPPPFPPATMLEMKLPLTALKALCARLYRTCLSNELLPPCANGCCLQRMSFSTKYIPCKAHVSNPIACRVIVLIYFFIKESVKRMKMDKTHQNLLYNPRKLTCY